MLADAGTDFIFFDFTNGPIGKESLDPFLSTAEAMRAEGIPVPYFVFFLNANGPSTLDWIYTNIYQPGKYSDLWFKWDGKPLLLSDPAFASSPEIANFFTIRHTWAFQSQTTDEWRFIDDYPQRASMHATSGQPDAPEEICVSKAMGAPLWPVNGINNKGASFHHVNGDPAQPIVPTYDAQWLSPDTAKGLFFEEQWSQAHKIDPEIVLVSGWNELTAGAWNADANMAGNYKFMGQTLNLNDWFFVDEFNMEFNRDIEPPKGGYTDNYYYQLVSHMRRYKGLAAPPPASAARTVAVDGAFADWASVAPVFHDPTGDTAHRNFQNADNSAMLVNDTGRNDIVESRATHDATNTYFYAKTADPLTPSSDPNWMLLYVDADRNKATGWQGYDVLIGLGGASPPQTPVAKWQNGAWVKSGMATIAYAKNELEIAIPKTVLGVGAAPTFDFHWADNIGNPTDVTEFFLNGDSAPDRRFDFRYIGLPAAPSALDAGAAHDAGRDAGHDAGEALESGIGPANDAGGIDGEASSASSDPSTPASGCGCRAAGAPPAESSISAEWLAALGIVAATARRRASLARARRSG